MTDAHKTHIPCTDGFHRKRSVGVWTAPTTGQLVLVAPPAEAALLSPTEARMLGKSLFELAAVTEQEHLDLVQAGKSGLVTPAQPRSTLSSSSRTEAV
ncbi:hypothetical protein EV186_106425 [Labedaea rhizosphaerae]|uniref:Uncharacterized protein n=2 Tax=Labedaea rhizosphaerae TaxID=598644 RepID=A0A4R6S363_LABRH|nr:hypothetical protein EV186_106425 [Labedaea rhizosphaerae]